MYIALPLLNKDEHYNSCMLLRWNLRTCGRRTCRRVIFIVAARVICIRVPEVKAHHIVGVASLLYGNHEGLCGVEDVGHQSARLGGGLREPGLQV